MKLKPILENAGIFAAFAVGAFALYYFGTTAIANRQANNQASAFNNAIAGYDAQLEQQQQLYAVLGSLGITSTPSVVGNSTAQSLSLPTVTPPVIQPVGNVTLPGATS